MFDDFESWSWVVIAVAAILVVGWVGAKITYDRYMRDEARSSGRRRSRRRKVDWTDFTPRDLGTLVAMLRPDDRARFADELSRVVERHAARRFQGVIEVRRGEVSVTTYTVLWEASNQHRLPLSSVPAVQISRDDAKRLLKACEIGSGARPSAEPEPGPSSQW